MESVLEYFREKQPRLRQPAETGKPLALPPKAFLALISFLQGCRSRQLAAAARADAETLPEAGLGFSETYTGLYPRQPSWAGYGGVQISFLL